MREPDPKQPVNETQPQSATSFGSQRDYELMPQCKNLDLERGSTPKASPNRGSEGKNEGERSSRELSFPRHKFNWLNMNRVFSRDRVGSVSSTFTVAKALLSRRK